MSKLLRNKRGVEDTVARLFFWMVYIVAVGLSVSIMAGQYFSLVQANTEIDPDVEKAVGMQVLLTDPNCFAYRDASGTYPLHIDLNKFTQDRLEQCIDDSMQQYRVDLVYSDSASDVPLAALTSEQWSDREIFVTKQFSVRVHHNGVISNGFITIQS